MSFNIPNQDLEFFYMVKNPQAVDIAAANKEWASGSFLGTDYSILEFSSSHTFDVATDYSIQITEKEKQIAEISPAFVDWNDLNVPAQHMALHNLIRPFEENDSQFCSYLIADTKAHLRYVIGASSIDISDMYNGALLPVGVNLAMGDVGAAAAKLFTYTALDLQLATGHGTEAQWQQFLDHVGMMAGPFLQKFPR